MHPRPSEDVDLAREATECPGGFAAIWALFEQGALIPRCAWCERVLLDAVWTDPPQAALAAIDARMTMTHTICPRCIDAAGATRPAPTSTSGSRRTTRS